MVERRIWRNPSNGRFSKPGFGIPTDLVRIKREGKWVIEKIPLPTPIEVPVETTGFVEIYYMYRNDKRKKSENVHETSEIRVIDPRDFFLPEFEGQIRQEKQRTGGDAWNFKVIRKV